MPQLSTGLTTLVGHEIPRTHRLLHEEVALVCHALSHQELVLHEDICIAGRLFFEYRSKAAFIQISYNVVLYCDARPKESCR